MFDLRQMTKTYCYKFWLRIERTEVVEGSDINEVDMIIEQEIAEKKTWKSAQRYARSLAARGGDVYLEGLEVALGE